MARQLVPVMVPSPSNTQAAVSFTFDRRPEAATQVHIEAFEGPLGLLLSLIEQRQLDVLTVRLGDLAGAYLEALSRLPGDRLPHVSTFVTVAAQLILIKSRALLPRPSAPPAGLAPEEADPEEALRRRLIVYRLYRDASVLLGQRLRVQPPLHHREAAAAAAAASAAARPADERPLDVTLLAAALVRSARLVPPTPPLPEVLPRSITLADRTSVIRFALAGAPSIVLQDLLAGMTDRVVMAVTFLALLELVKRREVVAEQAEPWGP
ncbi:MAG: segregation/condensation protein A, partial [Candidatus Limnocylindrales bacterium]